MAVDPRTLAEEWDAWRAAREEELREPHGWLSLTALHWLPAAQEVTLPGVPGRWSVHDDGVLLTDAAGLSHAGEPVEGELVLSPVEGGGGITLDHGERLVEIIQRGGAYALRVRDPQAPTRTGFAGVPMFALDPRWALDAVFEAYETPRTVHVGAVIPGLTHEQSARGVLRFAVDGVPQALTAMDAGDGSLSVLFRDATSGVSTHAGARSLTVPEPGVDGAAVVDFNRAVNMPCAFTEYGTCPLPPPENLLSIAVEAGERTPR
ncbi:hypothetical protein Cme02nite_67560 [Catellatospora methionotrophica]|uniref:DUF1684 domain-containing protein n=1 Tax=Catellatospora methionotrophica TaxID=121620 RepID=A0A8J3PJ49_9ACTN|nr:DUF1684 domain-containing protein [Catellatospora methionotrophica]GIG18424.1 hypothetical protein Cme02nite_67560 [Catellatospora methionotrophica]